MSQGYFNQELVDPHGASAFTVPGRGKFEYTRSSMGLNSSPAAFQRLMDFVIKGLDRVFVYLDDMVISTHTFLDHIEKLEATLIRLRKHKLKLNLRKAHFGKTEVTYLGYQISKKTIRPGARKTQTIAQASPP